MFTSRNMLVLFKKEAAAYTDPTPTPAANSVPVLNESQGIRWGVTGTGAQKVSSPWGGETAEVMASRKPTFSYVIPFYAKGLDAGVIVYPRWVTDILSTCHDTFVGSGDTTQLTLTPSPFYPINTDASAAVTANKTTFTIYEYKGLDGAYVGGSKTLTKLVGCRLTRVSWQFRNGVPLSITIEGVGVYEANTATVTTDLSGATNDGYSGSDNVVMNGLQTEITPAGGAAIACLASQLDLTFEFAAEHIEGDDARSGVAATSVSDISVTGSINPLVEPGDVAAWLGLVSSKTRFALGTAANGVYPDSRVANTGYGVRVALSAGQAQGDTLARDRAVLDLPLTFIATRPSISGAPATVQII
jgi:hypothetical protein